MYWGQYVLRLIRVSANTFQSYSVLDHVLGQHSVHHVYNFLWKDYRPRGGMGGTVMWLLFPEGTVVDIWGDYKGGRGTVSGGHVLCVVLVEDKEIGGHHDRQRRMGRACQSFLRRNVVRPHTNVSLA